MIQITIHTDEGDAFAPRPGPEVHRLLLTIAGTLINLLPSYETRTVQIKDVNGNECGTIRYVADERPEKCDFARCGCHTITGEPIHKNIATSIEVALKLEFGEHYTSMGNHMKADLVMDVRAIMREDLDADDPTNAVTFSENAREAAHLLYSRIGGSGNLLSYATTIGAGPGRGRRRPRG